VTDRALTRIKGMKVSLPRSAAGWGAILAVALGGAATAGADARPPAAGARVSAAAAASNQARAAGDVRALLDLVRLPAGSERVAGAPAGTSVIDNELPSQATPNLVDAHSWWRVPGTLDAVLAYLKAHPPRGLSSSGSGSGSSRVSGPGSRTVFYGDVNFSFPALPAVLDSRTLIVKATSIGADVVAVRVDAEDAWEIPRPASERIPAGVHEVDVVRAVVGRPPTVSAHVVDASEVAGIMKLIDALPIVQPGVVSCPMIPAGAPTVTLTFRGKSAGVVLARAAQLALPWEIATSCDPVALTIGGRAQHPLLAGSGFLTAIGKLLGLPLAASG
jgi:hypothetical protein